MRVLNLLLAIWLVLAAAGCGRRPVDPRETSIYGLTDQEIKEWQEIGAGLGWLGPDPNFSILKFSTSRDALAPNQAVPAFSWGLSRRYNLESLVNRPVPITPFGLKLFGFIDQPWPGADNEELKLVAGIKNLTALSLNSMNVNDQGLQHLAAMKLTHLDLYKTKVTDAGMKNLAEMKSLICLDLSGTAVTDDGLAHLSGLTGLMFLGLPSEPSLSDTGLKHLAGLTELTALALPSKKVTDAGLKHLARMTKLKRLDLTLTEITDEGLKELANMKSLIELTLPYRVLTDRALESLLEMRLLHALPQAKGKNGSRPTRTEEITSLNLGSTKVTDASLKHLSELRSLTELNLDGALVTDAGLKHLADFKNLGRLVLWNTNVTAAGVRELRRALPHCGILTNMPSSPE